MSAQQFGMRIKNECWLAIVQRPGVTAAMRSDSAKPRFIRNRHDDDSFGYDKLDALDGYLLSD